MYQASFFATINGYSCANTYVPTQLNVFVEISCTMTFEVLSSKVDAKMH